MATETVQTHTYTGDSSTLWKFFELRHHNLQSISRAQKVHLTTALVQLTLFWAWYLSGAKDPTIQGFPLTARGIWFVTPGVLTFFFLAFVGSINAALPALQKLSVIAKQIQVMGCECDFVFYDLDTDKNVLDYMAFLRVNPKDNNFDKKGRHDIRCFLYPTVLLACSVTTVFASVHVPAGWPLRIGYLVTCTLLQVLFGFRVFSRHARRFKGDDVDQ